MEEEYFLGYKIKNNNNSIHLRYDKEQYKQIIQDAVNANMTPHAYVSLLSKPCAVCGNDLVQMNLIKRDIKRKSNVHSVHLFVFHISTINSQVDETKLKIKYVLSGMLQIDPNSIVYTPKGTHRYSEGKDNVNATITVFKNDVRSYTMNCIIINNEICPNENI